jgi:carbon monoxide dehydrogenase subunit G
MELEHSFTVPVPEERAWEVLLDVERVAPCMPGASLDSVDGDDISGRIKVKVGPIAMTYAGTARFTERDPAAHVITLEAAGKETRGAGTASATVRSKLEGQGDKTHVIVHTTLNVTGRPAQFGRGVMAEVGGRLIGIFAKNLADMLTADRQPASTPGGTAAGATAGNSPAGDSAAGSSTSGDSTSGGSAVGDSTSGGATSGGAASAGPAADGSAPGGTGPQAPAASGSPAGAAAQLDTSAGQADPASGADAASQLAAPVEELQLSLRSYNSLRRDGIHTIGELASRSGDDLLAIENIGPASVAEIRQKLADRGLALADARPSTAPPGGVGPQAGMSAATGRPSPAAASASTASASTGAASASTASDRASANGLPSDATAAQAGAHFRPRMDSRPPDEDAIDLLSVAGLPVLKRVLPAAAALVLALLIVLGLRRRKRARA